MKNQRLITIILSFFSLQILLTSCYGYNPRIRNQLSNEKNYHSYYGKICDIYYYDTENNKVSLLSSDDIPDCDVELQLTFDEPDTIEKFSGGKPNPEFSLDEYNFVFRITKENHQILSESGFYSLVTKNTPIEITASSYIYMDSNYFFIAAVTYNETAYLGFEDGFKNIQQYISENKSLL